MKKQMNRKVQKIQIKQQNIWYLYMKEITLQNVGYTGLEQLFNYQGKISIAMTPKT